MVKNNKDVIVTLGDDLWREYLSDYIKESYDEEADKVTNFEGLTTQDEKVGEYLKKRIKEKRRGDREAQMRIFRL